MKKTLLLISCTFISSISLANAQSTIESKVDRIERRMIAMERQVFSGKSAVKTISPQNELIAGLQAKLMESEEQNAKLYGKVEELGYAMKKLAEQVKLASDDFDFRLNDLESKTSNIAKNSNNSKDMNSSKDLSVTSAMSRKAVIKSTVPEKLSAEKLYQKAFSYLTATEYNKSKDWFEAFIERFPTHKLADNSYYWLGEINLVQANPKSAILSFSKGLKKFPTGEKAPANLLKIGVAFQQMGNLKHAKSSWTKLLKDYPNAPEAAKASDLLSNIAK